MALGSPSGAESDRARAVAIMDSTGLREYAAEVFEALGSLYQQQALRRTDPPAPLTDSSSVAASCPDCSSSSASPS